MTDKNDDQLIDEASSVKEMMANSSGWKVVKSIIREMEERAFEEWGELGDDTKPEKVSELRYTKRILKKLMDEIQATIALGQEAFQRKEVQKETSVKEAAFVIENSTENEMEALSKPQGFIERIFGRQTQNGSAHKEAAARR